MFSLSPSLHRPQIEILPQLGWGGEGSQVSLPLRRMWMLPSISWHCSTQMRLISLLLR